MRKVTVSRDGLDFFMSKAQAIHAPVVVPELLDSDSEPFYLVYYEPHTNFRLEDFGEVWDEDGEFVR